MTRIENDCYGCDLTNTCCSCPMKRVPHTYCDICGNEAEEMYEVDEKDVCGDCLFEYLINQGVISPKSISVA